MPLVKSEAINQIEYDPEGRVLFIEFHDTGWYSYAGVPPEVHEELMTARSIGAYFNQRIRNHYPETKVVSFDLQGPGSVPPGSSRRNR
jgi:hypothetical protein